MEFDNTFSIRAPLTTVWDVLLDAQQVAPCVPGAEITEIVDETHYKGTVKVKLGAVQMTYRGELEVQPNQADRTIVLDAKGSDVRSAGGASGVVTTRLSESDGVTQVEIHSRVDVTGRAAQFGRGIMQDVAGRLIRQFATCLEEKLQSGGDAGEATDAESTPETIAVTSQAPEPQAILSPPTEPVTPSPPAPPTPAVTATAPPTPPRAGGTAPPATQISVTDLLADVLRSRVATWLRALATRIEPH